MISRVALFTALVSASAPIDPCPAICAITSDCRRSKYGSYCKRTSTPNVCFGLYHLPDGTLRYCFQPEDPYCNDARLSPVRCDLTDAVVTPQALPEEPVKASVGGAA